MKPRSYFGIIIPKYNNTKIIIPKYDQNITEKRER